MQSAHSFFYKQVFEAFGVEKASSEAEKEKAGVKYVWRSSRAEKYRKEDRPGPGEQEEKRPGAGRGILTYTAAAEPQRRREPQSRKKPTERETLPG